MNIHEHQAKELLRGFGVAVPKGIAAFTVDEAVSAAKKLGGDVTVVKAQIHAGGRGKAGGVKVVNSVAEVKTEAQRILGSTLVTHQTGPAGKQVQRLYIEEGCDIATELYLSMLVDRSSSQITIIASTEGGMDIEAVAAETPERILTISIDPATGLHYRRPDEVQIFDSPAADSEEDEHLFIDSNAYRKWHWSQHSTSIGLDIFSYSHSDAEMYISQLLNTKRVVISVKRRVEVAYKMSLWDASVLKCEMQGTCAAASASGAGEPSARARAGTGPRGGGGALYRPGPG